MYSGGHVVVIGERNLLHWGVFELVHTLAYQHRLQILHSCTYARWIHNSAVLSRTSLSAALLCLPQSTYLPEWINMVLAIGHRVNRRIVIFVDDVSLLHGAPTDILRRVIPEEHILHTRMCRHKINQILSNVLTGKVRYDRGIQLTQRELEILDGFVKGIPAEQQSVQFGIDRCTVYQHRKNCANKLGLKRLKDLTRIRLGVAE